MARLAPPQENRMDTHKVTYCPYCGGHALDTAEGGYLEAGQWDGKQYAEERDLNDYYCRDCRAGFYSDYPMA